MATTHITPADGNIFEDLGLPDAENLKLRAELMSEIGRFYQEQKDNGLKQKEVAELLKTTAPRLNDVLKGRIEKCTIDRLVNMLAQVGRHVTITITGDKAA